MIRKIQENGSRNLLEKVSFDNMISEIKTQLGDDHIVINDGTSCDVPNEFWHHYEVYTGSKVPKKSQATAFYCSC